MSEVKGGPERSVQPQAPAGAEKPAAGASAAPAEQGWRPDQDAGIPVTPKKRSGMRLGQRAAAAGVLAGVLSGGALASAGADSDTSIQAAGSSDKATTRTVDTSGPASPLDLDRGTFSIGSRAAETPVQLVSQDAPLQAPTGPEDHSEAHQVKKGETVGALVHDGMHRGGIDHTDQAQVGVGIAVEAALNPAIGDLDKIYHGDNAHPTTLELADDATLASVASAVKGTNPDGSPVDAAIVTAADEVEKAVKDHGYDSPEAQQEAAELLQALNVATPDQTIQPAPVDADNGGQDNQTFEGVERRTPTISDADMPSAIDTAVANGVVVVTPLTADNIWDQQQDGADLTNATTNITSRAAVILSQFHSDSEVNQDGKFNPNKMHDGDKFAQINPELYPLITAVSSLSHEQMLKLQDQLSPQAFQALVAVWDTNYSQTDVSDRDRAMVDVALAFGSLVDFSNPSAELQGLIDQLKGKTPQQQADILAQAGPGVLADLVPTAVPDIDTTTPGPGVNEPGTTIAPDGTVVAPDAPRTTTPAPTTTPRATATPAPTSSPDASPTAAPTTSPDASPTTAPTTTEAAQPTTEVTTPPAASPSEAPPEPVTEIQLLLPGDFKVDIEIPDSILNNPDPVARAEALKVFVDQQGDTYTKTLEERGTPQDGNVVDAQIRDALIAALTAKGLNAEIPPIHPEAPATQPIGEEESTTAHGGEATPTDENQEPGWWAQNFGWVAGIGGGVVGAALLAAAARVGFRRRGGNRRAEAERRALEDAPEIAVRRDPLDADELDDTYDRLRDIASGGRLEEAQESLTVHQRDGIPTNTIYTRHLEDIEELYKRFGFSDTSAADKARVCDQARIRITDIPDGMEVVYTFKHRGSNDPDVDDSTMDSDATLVKIPPRYGPPPAPPAAPRP